MKIVFTLLALTILCTSISAQDKKGKMQIEDKGFKTKVKEKPVWDRSISLALFAGQTGSKNWASGSDYFSLSANAFLHAHADRTRGRWYWNNNFDASFGSIWMDEHSTIKDDDKIDYLTTLGMKSKKLKNIEFGAIFNFRSQFASGYDRDYLNQGLMRRTSGLFAPAYFTFAPMGIQWQNKHVNFYLTPAAGRLVVVSNAPYSYVYQGGVIPANMVNDKNLSTQERSLASMYGVDPAKEVRLEFGAYFSAGYQTIVTKNVSLHGRLDAFSDVLHHTPENIDIFWTNTFTLKVNNWLNVLYSLDIASDDDIRKFGYFGESPAIQLKSILGVGITGKVGGKNKMMRNKKGM